MRALLAAGHDVIGVDRDTRRSGRLRGLEARIALRDLDLSDRLAVCALLDSTDPEGVIHLAWYARATDYLVSKRNLESLATTLQLTDELFARGCRKLVGAGTCLEYAPSPAVRREGDPERPDSLYAACKLAAGHILRALALSVGAELAWGRVFHVHGPAEARDRLLPHVASELRRGVRVELTDGTQLRDHLHVADVASAFVALLAPGASGVYNVCSGEPVTLRCVLELVGEQVGRPELLGFGARAHRPDEVMALAGDSSRLRALGWQPRFGLRDGIADALRLDGAGSGR